MTLFRDLLIEKKRRRYYCEVEYLESTGQQTNETYATNASWIDTGIIPDDTTKIECRVAFTTLVSGTNTEALFGSTGSSYGNYRFAFGYASISPYTNFYIGLGGQNLTTSLTRDTNAHTFKIDAINKTWAIDDTSGSFTSAGSISSTASIFLFARHNPYYGDNVANKPANARTYYCKIWNGGSLVRDMIPVLDWNYTPCMYDKITGQLFYTKGTKQFSYGREIHYVEYLESTGTQYIDTGVTLTNNHSVEVDYQLTSASQNRKGIFGGLVTNSARFGALLSPSNNYLEFGYGSTNVWYQPGLLDTNRHVMKQAKNLLYFDGSLAYTFNTATFTQNFTAPLGNFTYTNYNPASAKYYSSKWWDGDTLVRDYKPAIDENGVCFWFDKVTHSCFLNAGTGAFKYPAKEVSYLQSTGTQYIDTNYMPNQDTKIELVGKFNNSFPGCLWATRWSQSPNYDTYGAYAENNSAGMLYIYYGRYSSGNFTSVSNATFPHRDGNFISFIQDKNKLDFTNLGTNANWTYTFGETTFQATRNLTLFYFSSSSAFATKGGYIKSCKIWDNNVMVRDMVTCFKDGVMGMWDKANSVFYQNAGTGTFTKGKIVESRYE